MFPALYFIHINLFLLVVVLIYLFSFYTLTVEMARRKSVLHMCSKNVTVEGASTKHVDEETNQEMHEASTQRVGSLESAI